MKKLKFIKVYVSPKGRVFQPNWVIGTSDSFADQMVAQGYGKIVPNHIRPFKYAIGQPLQVECVTPMNEDLEASPKGAATNLAQPAPLSTRGALTPQQVQAATKRKAKKKQPAKPKEKG